MWFLLSKFVSLQYIPLTETELAEAFQGKDLTQKEPQYQSGKSLLAQQLEQFPNLPQNPYQSYAKCDGSVSKLTVTVYYFFRVMSYLKLTYTIPAFYNRHMLE